MRRNGHCSRGHMVGCSGMTHHQLGIALRLLFESWVGSEPAGGGRKCPLGKGSSGDGGGHGCDVFVVVVVVVATVVLDVKVKVCLRIFCSGEASRSYDAAKTLSLANEEKGLRGLFMPQHNLKLCMHMYLLRTWPERLRVICTQSHHIKNQTASTYGTAMSFTSMYVSTYSTL